MTEQLKSKCCSAELTTFTDVEEGTSWYLCSKCNEACDVAGGKWRFNLGKLNQNYVRTGDQPMPEEEKLTTNKMMQLVQSNCCGALIGIYEHPICTQCNKKCEISHEELQFDSAISAEETETLRDKFAMQILPSLLNIYKDALQNFSPDAQEKTNEIVTEICQSAYAIANIIMIVRKQK